MRIPVWTPSTPSPHHLRDLGRGFLFIPASWPLKLPGSWSPHCEEGPSIRPSQGLKGWVDLSRQAEVGEVGNLGEPIFGPVVIQDDTWIPSSHQVASAASDGLLRLDLDVPDSGPPVFAPVNDVSETQPQEPPRVLMPPVKPSPVPETCSTDDSMETPAGERGPTPVSASPEAKPESQEDAETPAEGDSDFKRHPNSTWFERLKVSWENPSPEESAALESSQLPKVPSSETPEAAPRESKKPPVPPPKILSEKMKACMGGVDASSLSQSSEAPETTAPGPTQVSVNGMDDSPESAVPSQAMGTPGTAPEGATAPPALPFWDLPSQFHPRSSSLGDLLRDGPQHPKLPKEKLYRAQLEVKVASKQTEQLLNQVLSSEPQPVCAESLLSQAVEQLRQATQVLQEMRDLGELNQETPGLVQKRKELVTLYRRSAP